MTTFQAARNLETTKKRAADEAPKHYTKKPKTSISVASLFAKRPRAVREDLQSADGTSRKRTRVEDEITAKAKRHPIYLDVKGMRLQAITVYNQDESCSVAEELDTTYDELTARIEKISISSKQPNSHGTTQDANDDSTFSRPLSEDVLTVSVSKPDGHTARRDVQLGDSMQKMAKLIDDTELKVSRLKDELEEVSEDIGSVLREYQQVTKSVCKAHEGKRTAFLSDVQAFHKSVVDNIVEARMEDKKQTVEAQRKLQAFAASLI